MPIDFGRWFRAAPPVEDAVWLDAPAREAGIRAHLVQGLAKGGSALLLARTRDAFEDNARELAARTPLIADDRFAADALGAHLQQPGALGLARVDDLRPTPHRTAKAAIRCDVHVLGRSRRRSEDRRLTDLLGAAFAPVRIVFHNALDDALLQVPGIDLRQMLEGFGWRAEESVASATLSRVIQRMQRD